MFEHLDSRDPLDPTPGARAKVSAHVERRTRRRRQRWALTGVAVLVVAAAVGVPLGLGAAHQKHPTDLVTTDRGAAPPSTLATPSTAAAPATTGPNVGSSGAAGMTSVAGVAIAPDGQAWAIGLNGKQHFVLDHSTDGGITWQWVPVRWVASLPASADPRLRAARGGRLWILASLPNQGTSLLTMTADGGVHWSSVPSAPKDIVDLQAVGSSVWALTDPCPGKSPSCTKVLMTSDDGGLTWSTPEAQPVTGSGTQLDLPYAGATRDEAVVREGTDDGWVFTPVASSVVTNPDSASSGAAGFTWNYVVSRTTDGGRSWQSLRTVSTTEPRPTATGVPYFPCLLGDLSVAPTGRPWFLCTGQGEAGHTQRTVLRLPAGSDSWTIAQHGSPAGSYPLKLIALDDEHALLLLQLGPVERTIDGGRTWKPVAAAHGQAQLDGGTSGPTALACTPTGACLLVASRDGDGATSKYGPTVWRSTDGGATWSKPIALSTTTATTVPPSMVPTSRTVAPSGARACGPGDLRVVSPNSIGEGLGNTNLVITFTNRSPTACVLEGYPTVAGVLANGQVVDLHAAHGSYFGSPGPAGIIDPGGVGALYISSTDNCQAAQKGASRTYPQLRIGLPAGGHVTASGGATGTFNTICRVSVSSFGVPGDRRSPRNHADG